MNRRAVALACVAAGALFALEGGAAELATESPVATIATLQAGLIAAAKPTIEERYRALEPLIVATHDLPYIAEFALRRQWPALTEGQRQRFVAAFQRLSVMTYAARFGNVAPDAFRALEAKEPDAGGRAQVATAIKREGQADVPLVYLLQEDAQGWRIVNIVADGVSDLALKRAEYQRLFASGGIEGLIAELEQQTERLARD
jgi:phospholipid transport system substrate-binding protein